MSTQIRRDYIGYIAACLQEDINQGQAVGTRLLDTSKTTAQAEGQRRLEEAENLKSDLASVQKLLNYKPRYETFTVAEPESAGMPTYGQLADIIANLVDDEGGIVRNHCGCDELEMCSVCLAKQYHRRINGLQYRVVIVDCDPRYGIVLGNTKCLAYAVNAWTKEQIFPEPGIINEKVLLAIRQTAPVKMFYGDTSEEAGREAQTYCEEHGWTIIV